MTRKADTLRPFLRCTAVVLCSLALPLAVFAVWDHALLAAPHTRTDGERFSAAGRANATACTLYAAEHVTKVPLGSNSLWDGVWTAGTMDGSALARARRTLRALHEAGLLCDDSYAAALQDCRVSVSTDGAVSDSSERLQRTVIESELRAYILDKAAQCGVSLADAQVTLQWSTDGYWYPYAVRLVTSGAAENSRLAQTIEADLGIPRARQEWSSTS